jgi:hypothetical protein
VELGEGGKAAGKPERGRIAAKRRKRRERKREVTEGRE